LAQRVPGSSTALQRAMLEVLLRRYYRGCRLDETTVVDVGGDCIASTVCERDGQQTFVVGAHIDHAAAPRALQAIRTILRATPGQRPIHVDLFTVCGTPLPSPAEGAQLLEKLLSEIDLPSAVNQVVVSTTGPTRSASAAEQYFTFRRNELGQLVEDVALRGLHPMLAKRLNLWRLARFQLERVPSPAEVFLFRAVAHENPKDERLFALA
jgi:Acetyl-CoA carboxylase, central region